VRDDTRAGIAGIAAFALSFLFGIAGSLMIAPAVAIMALVAFPVEPSFWRPGRVPISLIAGGLFLVWIALSFLWSPHDDPGQIWRTCLGIPLYALFAVRIGKLGGAWQRRVEAAVMFLVAGLGLYLFAEAALDGSATHGFKVAVEGMGSLPERDQMIHVNRNLGHAAVPLLLLSVPAALIAWREGGPLIGAIFVGLAAVAAFAFDTEVNTVAFVLAGIAAVLTVFWPRTLLAIVFGTVAGMLIVMPLALPDVIAHIPQGLRDAMPLSWVWRLEIWSYAGELIREKPWTGYGLDASRPLNAEMELAGYTIERLPLHPHNATLHIWLETGAVGAVLLASCLVAMGGRIAGAPQLSRLQAVGVVWVLVVYVSLIVFSYGVWQEWHQGTVALAATSVFFLGAKQPRGRVPRV